MYYIWQVPNILMKPRAASRVPWCNRHFSASKGLSAFATQSQASFGQIPFWNNFHSSDFLWVGQCHCALCLTLQTAGKLLLPPSYKPNVQNEFIFTLLVNVLQNIFWRSFHDFLLKLLERPGTLTKSRFCASVFRSAVVYGLLPCRLSSQCRAEPADTEACRSDYGALN